MIRIFTFTLFLTLALGINIVSAQEENLTSPAPDSSAENVKALTDLEQDENVSASDLEVSRPALLPDSPFYFLKEWAREIQTAFTSDSIKKVELKERFANEKLIELKITVEKNKNRERVEKALQNYQNELSEAKNAAEKIREKAAENDKVGNFLDKFVKQQALHQRILQKLEGQVPQETLEKIKETREMHLEKFGETMNKLEEKEKIGERLEKNLEELKGSEFKNFKNVELLKELEEKAPEEIKEALKETQQNFLRKLETKVKELTPQNQERFKNYIENAEGRIEKHMEIIENLKENLSDKPEIMNKIIESRQRIIERFEEKIIEKSTTTANSPACMTLWDPVCGKNKRTYSNECFARLDNMEISYKGECGTTNKEDNEEDSNKEGLKEEPQNEEENTGILPLRKNITEPIKRFLAPQRQ